MLLAPESKDSYPAFQSSDLIGTKNTRRQGAHTGTAQKEEQCRRQYITRQLHQFTCLSYCSLWIRFETVAQEAGSSNEENPALAVTLM